MLNDIIIDKLRIAMDVKSENTTMINLGGKTYSEFSTHVEHILEDIFPKYAFKVYKRYNNIYIEFNPTRINTFWLARKDKYDDVNLQMVPQEVLLALFMKIGLLSEKAARSFKVVELHLAKNFLLESKPSKYINMLANLKSKQVRPVFFRNFHSTSIYFSNLKINNKDKEYTGTRLIKMYDKIAEIKKKKNNKFKISHIRLREKLSEHEAEQLGKLYDNEHNAVDFHDANLLRIELTYKLSKNLKGISEKLGNGDTNELQLSSLISHLQNNTLYEKLDEFYKDELKDKLFCDDPNNPIEIAEGSNSYTKELSSMLLGGNPNLESELYYVRNLCSVTGLVGLPTIDKNLLHVNRGIINNKFYRELYSAVDTSNSLVFDEIPWMLYHLTSVEEQQEEERRLNHFHVDFFNDFEDD